MGAFNKAKLHSVCSFFILSLIEFIKEIFIKIATIYQIKPFYICVLFEECQLIKKHNKKPIPFS